MRAFLFMMCAVVLWQLGGCAAPEGETQLEVAPGAYAATFDAARRVIRDARFDLERVDATEGVISTRPKHSAGLMTLWDGEQSSAGQEIEDVVNNQRRLVRVTFEPSGAGEGADEETRGVWDLREAAVPLTMRVRVVVLRDYKPGWQVQTSSVRLSTHAYDPELAQRGMVPDFETAIDEDRALAGRLVKQIEAEAVRIGEAGEVGK
jgi:hypothetical protein